MAIARILKLLNIFERVPIQSGLKWSKIKMDYKCMKGPKFSFLSVKNENYLAVTIGPSKALRKIKMDYQCIDGPKLSFLSVKMKITKQNYGHIHNRS